MDKAAQAVYRKCGRRRNFPDIHFVNVQLQLDTKLRSSDLNGLEPTDIRTSVIMVLNLGL
jgi:hypothetical protein